MDSLYNIQKILIYGFLKQRRKFSSNTEQILGLSHGSLLLSLYRFASVINSECCTAPHMF